MEIFPVNDLLKRTQGTESNEIPQKCYFFYSNFDVKYHVKMSHI